MGRGAGSAFGKSAVGTASSSSGIRPSLDRRLLPAAGFTEVPDAGHFVAIERPDALAELLISKGSKR